MFFPKMGRNFPGDTLSLSTRGKAEAKAQGEKRTGLPAWSFRGLLRKNPGRTGFRA